MNKLLKSQLESLVRQYGVRVIANGLAEILEEGKKLPYDTEKEPGWWVEKSDLKNAAYILRGPLW